MARTRRESPHAGLAGLVGFDLSPVPTAVFAGPGLVTVALNDLAREWWGTSVLDTPAREALTGIAGTRFCEDLERVLATGLPDVDEDVVLHTTSPDGSHRRFVVDVVLEPWHDHDGAVVGVACYLLDPTEVSPGHDPLDTPERRGVLPALQDVLLPTDLPLLPGVDLAARYLPPERDSDAGGDWFDAVVRPEGRVAIVVGDIVGRGVDAFAAMAALQSVLHERLAAGVDLVEAVRVLDTFAVASAAATGATVGVVELDPTSGEVDYVLAGHPPPLVVDAVEGFRFLAPTGGRPLGTGGEPVRGRDVLGPAEVLLLYSDGLLERPPREIDRSTVELAQVAAEARHRQGQGRGADALDRMCTETLERLVRSAGHRDDVSLVAVQRGVAEDAFDVAVPVDGDGPARVRGELAGWLGDLGARLVDRVAVLHAAHEVIANAARHAYPDGATAAQRTVRLRGSLGIDGVLDVSVADGGRWQERDTTTHGRGLMVAGALVDGLHVDRGAGGTRVNLRHRLTRHSELLRVARQDGRPAEHAGTPLSLTVAGDVVRVTGDLHGDGVTQLRDALLQSCQAGCRNATVDLTGVTRLDGETVRVLFDVLDRCARHGSGLTLVAEPGSRAQHVLETAGLPYAPADPPDVMT